MLIHFDYHNFLICPWVFTPVQWQLYESYTFQGQSDKMHTLQRKSSRRIQMPLQTKYLRQNACLFNRNFYGKTHAPLKKILPTKLLPLLREFLRHIDAPSMAVLMTKRMPLQRKFLWQNTCHFKGNSYNTTYDPDKEILTTKNMLLQRKFWRNNMCSFKGNSLAKLSLVQLVQFYGRNKAY